MKLIIMTKPTFFVEEDKILTALFEMGLDHLHLYKPGTEPVYSERLLTLIPDEYYGRITVHDHFYLRDEFRLRGIHLDDCQTEPPIGYRGNISRTCHSIEELKDARKEFTSMMDNVNRILRLIITGEIREDDVSGCSVQQNGLVVGDGVFLGGTRYLG